MNNLENVRKCMRIKRTPNDAGTKLTIEFTYYDNGFVSINGSAKGDYTPDEAERWLASTRFVMQMIENSETTSTNQKLALPHKVQAKPLAVGSGADSLLPPVRSGADGRVGSWFCSQFCSQRHYFLDEDSPPI